jgi:hypothetical protein
MSETTVLAIISAITAIVTAVAVVFDIYRRHKVVHAHFVLVPNKNPGGSEMFCTKVVNGSPPFINAKSIIIKPDMSVEITFPNGDKLAYSKFISWKG